MSLTLIKNSAYQSALATRESLNSVIALKGDPEMLMSLWEIISGALHVACRRSSVLMTAPSSQAFTLISGTRIFLDANDFLSGKFTRGGNLATAERLAFSCSNAALAALMILKFGAFNLSSAALGALTMTGLAGAGVGFMCGSVRTLWNWAHLGESASSVEKRSHMIDFVASTTSVALPAIGLANLPVSSAALLALTVAAAAMQVLSFLYKSSHPELEKPADHEKLEGAPAVINALFATSDGLEKIGKFVNSLLKISGNPISQSIATHIDSFGEFYGAFSLTRHVKDWTFVDRPEDKLFWQKPTATGWTIAHKAFLTALSVGSTVRFMMKYQLAELNWIAKANWGGVSLLSLGVSGSVIGFSTCGLVNNALVLSHQFSSKKRDPSAHKVDSKTRIEARLLRWEKRRNILLEKNDLKAIEKSRQSSAKKMPSSAEAIYASTNEKYADWKIEQLKVRAANCEIVCNQAFLNIIANFSRITGASLGLTNLALVAATPLLPGVSTLAGVVTATVGLSSFCYGVLHPAKPLPSFNPH